LPLAGQRRVGEARSSNSPPVRPVVIEGAVRRPLSRVWDADEGHLPGRLEPTRTFGPGIEALLGYFHERHHVGYERLVEVCRGLRLTISRGWIDQALRRLAERARPTYEAIGAQVRAGPVIARMRPAPRGRAERWHWGLPTRDASYHVIVRGGMPT